MAPAGGAAARSHAARQLHKQQEEAKKNGGESDPVRAQSTKIKKETQANAAEPAQATSGFWKYQHQVEKVYKSNKCEIFVAVLIVANFLTNIVEKSIDPAGDRYETVWTVFETFYNVAFTIELGLNMYAFWLCRFWRSGWNVFDFIVVSIGVLTTLKVSLPGPLTMLRMMRAFRVFRLFKRVESLRKIMASLFSAIPGVVNAFVILILVMSIYAILAVEFWQEYGRGGTFVNEAGIDVPLQTPRGQDYGYEYFGNFPKALYTMFQVLTGESWSEAVARPLLHGPSIVGSLGVAMFFVSFVVINAIILINVVVAVLLEKMTADDEEEESEDGGISEEEEEMLEGEAAGCCAGCGKDLTGDSVFCRFCGRKKDKVASEDHADSGAEGAAQEIDISADNRPSGKEVEDTDAPKDIVNDDSPAPVMQRLKSMSTRRSLSRIERACLGADVRRVKGEVDQMKGQLEVVLKQLEDKFKLNGTSSTTLGASPSAQNASLSTNMPQGTPPSGSPRPPPIAYEGSPPVPDIRPPPCEPAGSQHFAAAQATPLSPQNVKESAEKCDTESVPGVVDRIS